MSQPQQKEWFEEAKVLALKTRRRGTDSSPAPLEGARRSWHRGFSLGHRRRASGLCTEREYGPVV